MGRLVAAMALSVATVAGCLPEVASAAPPAVTTTADSAAPGSGSLRAAVLAAAPGDTVVVPASSTPYTVTLGEIPITNAITIQGAGASTTVIDAGGLSRAFHVTTAVPVAGTVTFKDLTIKGGADTAAPGGGGILDESGALLLDGVAMTGNSATLAAAPTSSGGGAIYSSGGDVTVIGSTLSSNTTTVTAPGSSDDEGGAAIHVDASSGGTITITGSTIDSNHTTVPSGGCCDGGSVYQHSNEPVIVTGSQLNNNVLDLANGTNCCSGGGAIYLNSPSPLSITSSTLNDNTANVTDTGCCGGGGAVYGGVDSVVPMTLTGSTLDGNSTTVTSHTGESGGGALTAFEPLTASDSTLNSNTSTVTDAACCNGGGAVMLDLGGNATTRLTNVEMAHNISSVHSTNGLDECCNGGGALYSDASTASLLTAVSSDFSDNQSSVDSTDRSGGGGLLANDEGSDVLTNSTVSGNSTNAAGATDGGGGIYFADNNSSPRLSFDTIAGNSAPGAPGGGIFSNGVTIDTTGSIVALNTALSGANCGGTASPTFTSVGYNLEDMPDTCSFTAGTDKVLAGSLIDLGPLADNGGHTMTRALFANNPAIDAVPSAACTDQATPTANPIATDQRGLPRPQPSGGNCDIGAYEVGSVDLAATVTASPASLTVGDQSTLTFTISNAGPAPATNTILTLTLPPGMSFVSGSAGSKPCTYGGTGSVTIGYPWGPECPIGLLLAGGTVNVTVIEKATAAGTHEVTGTASADETDTTPSNNAATASLTVSAPTTPPPPTPTVTDASQSHKTWRDGTKLASFAAKHKKKPPVGTTFSFTLNEPAAVTMTFTQQLTGRKAKRNRCVAQTKKNHNAKKCTRRLTAGKLTHAAHSGANTVAFEGRLSRSKKLKPGRYTVVIAATAGGKTSAPVKLSFTVAPG